MFYVIYTECLVCGRTEREWKIFPRRLSPSTRQGWVGESASARSESRSRQQPTASASLQLLAITQCTVDRRFSRNDEHVKAGDAACTRGTDGRVANTQSHNTERERERAGKGVGRREQNRARVFVVVPASVSFAVTRQDERVRRTEGWCWLLLFFHRVSGSRVCHPEDDTSGVCVCESVR